MFGDTAGAIGGAGPAREGRRGPVEFTFHYTTVEYDRPRHQVASGSG